MKTVMSYDGALVMPSNYAAMSEDEMTYTEGGKGLPYSPIMRTKFGCKKIAEMFRNTAGYYNISVFDMTAEIYAHAILYYNCSLYLAVAGMLGLTAAAKAFMSLANGIDIENGVDNRKVKGIPLYQLYRAIYCVGPNMF